MSRIEKRRTMSNNYEYLENEGVFRVIKLFFMIL